MLRIATDVVLSISDANVLQRLQDVHDAASWIAGSAGSCLPAVRQ